MLKPIKRHPKLKPLSREHHHGLLLTWKIREGLKKGIDPLRIQKYTDWFWSENLIEHFKSEEEDVFPVLGKDHLLIKRALKEHNAIRDLFQKRTEVEETLKLLEVALNDHIRFEERELFAVIQEVATPEQFKQIEENERDLFVELWEDKFWE